MQRKSREAVSCRAETKKGTVSPSVECSSANWSSALNATVVGALSKHQSLVFGEEGGGRKVQREGEEFFL